MRIFNIKMIFITAIIIFVCSTLITACQAPNTYQGYAEGEYRYISSYYPGTLTNLAVSRGNWVEPGQALFTLEAQPESDQEKQAIANLQQTKAQLKLAEANNKRYQMLLHKGFISAQLADEASSQLHALQAELKNTQAAIAQARWAVGQKTVHSNYRAFVFDTYYLPGELVPAAHPIVSLLLPQDIKLIFFIPEPQLAKIQLGQKISYQGDGGLRGYANINYISPNAEYTPPLIYSESTQDKLLYQVEAKPLDHPERLHPGEPTTIKLQTS